MREAFRAMFPKFRPSEMAVQNVRRVVLLNYDKGNFLKQKVFFKF